MGGICGQIYFDTKKQIDENQIKKNVSSIGT